MTALSQVGSKVCKMARALRELSARWGDTPIPTGEGSAQTQVTAHRDRGRCLLGASGLRAWGPRDGSAFCKGWASVQRQGHPGATPRPGRLKALRTPESIRAESRPLDSAGTRGRGDAGTRDAAGGHASLAAFPPKSATPKRKRNAPSPSSWRPHRLSGTSSLPPAPTGS